MCALRRVDNPPNPFTSQHHEYLEEVPPARYEVLLDASRSILSHNTSPDIPFSWSANPYRGCTHACSYCYARPTHEYLGMGAGSDFDFKVVIKPEAPALLREAFNKPSWRGELVQFSGVTDCYQPLEAVYELTRGCLEVCLEYRNPLAIITKGALIERDLELLVALNAVTFIDVLISFPFLDAEVARAIAPAAPSPQRMLETIRKLSGAGLHVGVLVAPLIPGLNDRELPKLLAATREAGAKSADFVLLRLPGPVEGIFESRLREQLPSLADKVLNQLREARGGAVNANVPGQRMKGQGARYEAIKQLFRLSRRRLGFEPAPAPPDPSPFRRPQPPQRQLTLFD